MGNTAGFRQTALRLRQLAVVTAMVTCWAASGRGADQHEQITSARCANADYQCDVTDFEDACGKVIERRGTASQEIWFAEQGLLSGGSVSRDIVKRCFRPIKCTVSIVLNANGRNGYGDDAYILDPKTVRSDLTKHLPDAIVANAQSRLFAFNKAVFMQVCREAKSCWLQGKRHDALQQCLRQASTSTSDTDAKSPDEATPKESREIAPQAPPQVARQESEPAAPPPMAASDGEGQRQPRADARQQPSGQDEIATRASPEPATNTQPDRPLQSEDMAELRVASGARDEPRAGQLNEAAPAEPQNSATLPLILLIIAFSASLIGNTWLLARLRERANTVGRDAPGGRGATSDGLVEGVAASLSRVGLFRSASGGDGSIHRKDSAPHARAAGQQLESPDIQGRLSSIIKRAHTALDSVRAAPPREGSGGSARRPLSSVSASDSLETLERVFNNLCESVAALSRENADLKAASDKMKREAERQRQAQLNRTQELDAYHSAIRRFADGLPAFLSSEDTDQLGASLRKFLITARANRSLSADRLELALRSFVSARDAKASDQEIITKVQEIGERLFDLYYELGRPNSQQYEDAALWARAINGEAKGRFSVYMPYIGAAFDPLKMTGPATSVRTVSRIRAWGVNNARSLVARKAVVE